MNNIRNILLVLFSSFLLWNCKSPVQDQIIPYQTLEGEIFGTYYTIQIDSPLDFKAQIDSIYNDINLASNSYIPDSEISKFNETGSFMNPSPTFVLMLDEAKKYHEISEGYLEPTLYPLIKAWGKGFKNQDKLLANEINDLLKLVAFEKNIRYDSSQVLALVEGTKLDLSAIGEGFALEGISTLLDSKNIQNYMVEIGGEMNCKGVNPRGKLWLLGIENPLVGEEERGSDLMNAVYLDDEGLSTSGSYRKFYVDNEGNKKPHIIDPKTGYPVSHNLLSASLKAKSSIEADALSTACMAMGVEKAKLFIENRASIEGFLIYSEKDSLKTWSSKNFF